MGHLGWMARFSLTNVGMVFTEDHRNFSALIHISSSSGTNSADISFVFDYLATYEERKKIAVTLEDGTTQCYVEIIKWDVSSREAFLWANIPDIYVGDSSNLVLYFYFDPDQPDNDTYVCDLQETPVVKEVFFQAGIFHLSDSDPSSEVGSSGYYPWDMTTYNIDSGNIIPGKTGDSLELNGSDEYCEETLDSAIGYSNYVYPFCLECIIKTPQTSGNLHAITLGADNYGFDAFLGIGIRSGKASIFADDGLGIDVASSSATFADGQYHHLFGRFNSYDDRELYVDGVLVASSSTTISLSSIEVKTLAIGRTARLNQDYFEGTIEEVRFHLNMGFTAQGSTSALLRMFAEDASEDLYAAIDNSTAIQKSTDDGVTWNDTASFLYPAVDGHAVIVLSSNRILVGVDPSSSSYCIHYSDNGGSSWTPCYISQMEIVKAFLEDSGGNVWAAGINTGGHYVYLSKSTDGGATWSAVQLIDTNMDDVMGMFEDSAGNLYILVDPSSSNDDKIWRSTNGGSTWNAVSGLPFDAYPAYDIIQIGAILYSAINWGLATHFYSSSDYGATWSLVATLGTIKIRKLYYDSSKEILYGFGSYIARSFDLGANWETIGKYGSMDIFDLFERSNGDRFITGGAFSVAKETWFYSEGERTAEYGEASYLSQFDQLFYLGDLDSSHKLSNIYFSVLGKYDTSAFFTSFGKAKSDINFLTKCTVPNWDRIRFIVKCVAELYSDISITTFGKTFNDMDLLAFGKFYEDIGFIVQAIKSYGIRMGLTDPLNLRDTSVFAAPKELVYLPLVYGNFINSRIPCTPLDQDGYVQHISDGVIHSIQEVQRNGEPIAYGFTAYTNYQDASGKSIACVIFDSAQNDAQISVSCKGRVKETGELIENPADFLRDLFLKIQNYDPDVINETNLSKFYSDCINNNIRVAIYLNEIIELREIFDDLSINICAASIISDGKQRIRLKWID